ncbi:unnamed protein product [Acanthoscelides obtectus]|uniref:Uncharacterized protein n=1 Tax=Acanthoscelides obtectus TaxID=200917 RepID=A0A9P0Q6X4_ACAOB|nr:unnamed protein product [Acanthoscelides obtectus]CAK1685278.1 hypothetical protein AOBTE_LOCUS35298 [Acanthoscelides obtectus]
MGANSISNRSSKKRYGGFFLDALRRGRKCGQAKIITSTPNKDELEESINVSCDKVTGKIITNEAAPGSSNAPKRKRQNRLSTSSSSSQSQPAIVNDKSDDDELFLKKKPQLYAMKRCIVDAEMP